MKLYESSGFMLLVILAALAGIASQIWLGDDNAVEEACEAYIEAETGIDVDLTPNSKEII